MEWVRVRVRVRVLACTFFPTTFLNSCKWYKIYVHRLFNPRLILAEQFCAGPIQATAYPGRESVRINTLNVAPVFKGLKTVTSDSPFHTNRIVFSGLQHALSHRGHACWLRLRPYRYFRSYLVQSSPNSCSYGQYYTGSVRSFKTFCVSHHHYTANT